MINEIINNIIVYCSSQVVQYFFNRAIIYFTDKSHPRAKNSQNFSTELTPEKTRNLMQYLVSTGDWCPSDDNRFGYQDYLTLDLNNEAGELMLKNNVVHEHRLHEMKNGCLFGINDQLELKGFESDMKVNDAEHLCPGYYDSATGLKFFIWDKYKDRKAEKKEFLDNKIIGLKEEHDQRLYKPNSDFKNMAEWRDNFNQIGNILKEIKSIGEEIESINDKIFIIDEQSNDIVISFNALLAKIENDEKINYNFKKGAFKTILAQLLGIKIPAAYKQAARVVKMIKKTYPEKNIILTGICYGGSLAQYAALKNGVEAYCFNCLPMGSALQQDIGANKFQDAHRLITQISVKNDFVSDMPGIGYVDKVLTALGFETPANFGQRYILPPAQENYSLYQRHLRIKASMCVHAGLPAKKKVEKKNSLDQFVKYFLIVFVLNLLDTFITV